MTEDWHLSDDCREDGDDQDWTDPAFVTGAVLAQLEDLTDDQKRAVLRDLLAQLEES